jgi:membrane fusion protein (multidrug efflux system)
MRGKWLLISVLAVAVGIGAGVLSVRRRATPPPAPPNGGALLVRRNELTLSGNVQPQHVVTVGSTVEGNIEAFLADVGEEVFEGQVLARIGSAGLETTREQAQADAEHAQDQVTRAEAAVNAARLEASRADAMAQRSRLEMDRAQKVYDRQTTLHNAGATPRMVFEKAQAEFTAAQADFQTMDKASRATRETLQEAMNRVTAAKTAAAQRAARLEESQTAFQAAEVRAPAAGTIVGRKGEAGKPAEEAGDQMFRIATDLYALEVKLEPKPDELARIHPGQEAVVLLLDLQGAGLQGTVKEVKDGAVTVEFAGAIPGIKPGMRADVRLKLD